MMKIWFQGLFRKVLIFIATLITLHFLSWITILADLGLLLLALCLTEIIVWIIWIVMPREYQDNLADQAVLITGCDSGFGHKLAKKLDKKGVTVYAGCLFPDGDGALELKNSCSSKLNILHLDITKDDHVQEAVKIVSDTLGDSGELLAVVNNAGIATIAEVEWCPLEVYQKHMEVNTFGAIRVTKAFLPLLRKSRGRVVIVASYLGRHTIFGTSAYCMSKYAIISLADALRRELLKWSISVHTIEPWLYRTNLVNRDVLFNGMEKHWNLLPSDIQTEYGEKYIHKFKKSIKTILYLERSAIDEVVDDMEHAAIGKAPKTRYSPGPWGQAWVWLRACVPEELMDYVMYKTFPIPK